jgi:serine/threonine-protein kinase
MNRSILKPDDLIGTTIFGEYQIERKLGEGGMGAVFQARQRAIDQDIAIKVLLAEAAQSDELVQRFHREAKVISMLSHPNIIRVFIFGRMEQNGALYLAMEFVKGQSLRDVLGGKPMEELRAIKMMKQCCSALAEAHDLGIVHRDLKPDNILLTTFRKDPNFVKILDFGIAKLNAPGDQSQQAKLTQAGIVYGTPEYLSPEQAQALELDQRTDIYSLGVMLFEMMTGRVPFIADSPVKILTKHVFEPTPSPNSVAGGRIAPTMEAIIMKSMAKKPADRYQNAMEMFRALVQREMEILRERGLAPDANYVPGGELTGIFQAITVPPPGAVPAQPAARPGVQPPSTQPVQRAPDATMSVSAPPANNSQDMQRKLMMGLIAMCAFMLVVLVSLIIVLVLKK